jgi:hypothetical protein
MSVTLRPAVMARTRAYVYATSLDGEAAPVHVCGFQNEARSLEERNLMFLNFAGSNLSLVNGPEQTEMFMSDVTRRLPGLVTTTSQLTGIYHYGSSSFHAHVENYGGYATVLAQRPVDIIPALAQLPEQLRPVHDEALEARVDYFRSRHPDDSFVLAGFDGRVKLDYPIVVRYTPHNPQLLTVPGLEARHGNLPDTNVQVRRDARIAFAVEGVQLPYPVAYQDDVDDEPWAPESVTGFVDNRRDVPNGDYVVPVDAVRAGLAGRTLAAELRGVRSAIK